MWRTWMHLIGFYHPGTTFGRLVVQKIQLWIWLQSITENLLAAAVKVVVWNPKHMMMQWLMDQICLCKEVDSVTCKYPYRSAAEFLTVKASKLFISSLSHMSSVLCLSVASTNTTQLWVQFIEVRSGLLTEGREKNHASPRLCSKWWRLNNKTATGSLNNNLGLAGNSSINKLWCGIWTGQ